MPPSASSSGVRCFSSLARVIRMQCSRSPRAPYITTDSCEEGNPYAALPPLPVPSVDVLLPIGSHRPFGCLFEVIGLVGGADRVIGAAQTHQRRLCSR